jgi:hypothetical protein
MSFYLDGRSCGQQPDSDRAPRGPASSGRPPDRPTAPPRDRADHLRVAQYGVTESEAKAKLREMTGCTAKNPCAPLGPSVEVYSAWCRPA